jgi:hypothetical protein
VAIVGSGLPPFTLTNATGSGLDTVTAGGTAMYSIFGLAAPGFTGVIQLACAGAPQYAKCSVQPSTMDFSTTSSANVIVTVTTGSTAASTGAAPHTFGSPIFLVAALGLPFFFVLQRRVGISVVSVILIVCSLGVGCGGGGTAQTPAPAALQISPGTYTISITATGPTQTQTIPLTLIVR